jgi:S1-C subfamily serine protease
MPLQRLAALIFLLLSPLCTSAFAQAQPAAAETLGPGVVVEEVEKKSAVEKAGLQDGDVLLGWSRGDHAGVFESPFDLITLQTTERPLGTVTVTGLRGDARHQWEMGGDAWGITSSPKAMHWRKR